MLQLLAMYPGVKMVFVAPDVVRMRDDIKEFLTARGVEWSEATDLKVGVGLGLRG
jgi:aspartate carbamoyltransferase catalytic subunit